jgi:hypothetical protein
MEDYLIPLIPFAAGWIAGFAIAFIGFWVCCCNWCCMHGCCKCCAKKCFKCCAKSKTKKREMIWWIGGIVLMAGVVSVSIAGMVFLSRFIPAIDKFLCTTSDFLATAHDGYSTGNWIGLSPGIDSLDSINNNFNNIKGNLSSVSNSFTDMDTKLAAVLTAIDFLYTNNNAVTVARGDPRQTTAYAPDYVSNLGPSSSSSTYTGLLRAEMIAKNDTVQPALVSMNSSVGSILGDVGTIQSAFSTATS